MDPHIFLTVISLPFVTILLVFGMKYFSAIQQAKARSANDEAYRQLAAQVVAAQADTAATLAAIDTSLADLKTRLAALEKILKEVE
jgi:signal transduction histidine kinase